MLENTTIYEKFLEHYQRSGSLSDSLSYCNLTIHELKLHQQNNTEFDKKYRTIHSFIATNKTLLAREKLNDLRLQHINRGYIIEEETSREITRVPGDNGEQIVKVLDKVKHKKRALPESYYQHYLNDSTDIVKAISTLSDYGLIPSSYAEKVLAMKEEITEKIKLLLTDGNQLTEDKDEKQILGMLTTMLTDI